MINWKYIYYKMDIKSVLNLTDMILFMRLVKSDKAMSIRVEMYTCISPETGALIANKYHFHTVNCE